MKKTVIIFCILFALTLAVPAIVCTTAGASGTTQELVSLFN